MSRIFISYKRRDKNLVFPIKDKIEAVLGEECWIDLDGIESDAQFASVIIKAIKEAEVFLFMYSSSHVEITDFQNDWTIKELNFAKAKKKRIVFVKLDSAELSDWFEFEFPQKQLVDSNNQMQFEKLINDLRLWLNLGKTIEPNSIKLSIEKMFEFGEVYEKDFNFVEAVKWYRMAAEAGYSLAQYSLGRCLYFGRGIDRDSSEAVKWYRLAANQGNDSAQYDLGCCYEYGEGVEVDVSEAVKWYKLAVEKGNSDAMFNLAECYYYGKGMEINYDKAIQLYSELAERGKTDKFLRDSPDTKKSLMLYKIAADSGDIIIQEKLGNIYCFGWRDIAPDVNEAIKWYKLAVEHGSSNAKTALKKLGVG